MPVTPGASPTEVNFDSSVLTAPPGRKFAVFQADAAVPDPNNPQTSVRDLGVHSANLGGVDARTGTTEEITASSQGKLVTLSNGSPVGVELMNGGPDDFMCWIANAGAGVATLTPETGTIDLLASIDLAQYQSLALFRDGANWKTSRGLIGAVPTPGTVVTVGVVSLSSVAPGNFTVAHGSPSIPIFVLIQPTSGGAIWLQDPTAFDATDLYLVASDSGVTALAYIWTATPDQIITFTTSGPGNFSLPHGLGVSPGLALVELRSGGAVWSQSTPWDSANINLVASDAGLVGRVILWKLVPTVAVIGFSEISLAPGSPGNFTIAHGLGKVPAIATIRMTSSGAIWPQTPTPFDSTNLYLTASDGGITGKAEVWTG
jgi:hypothetical protein